MNARHDFGSGRNKIIGIVFDVPEVKTSNTSWFGFGLDLAAFWFGFGLDLAGSGTKILG